MATKKSDPTSVATESTGTKTVEMPYGVPGYTLHEIQRQVPTTEPPVLPVNAELQYIGKSPTRWDAHAKVSGSGRYTADVQLPGMLYAKMVMANVPHARIVSIDTSAAEKFPGVKGVYVVQHVLDEAVLRDPSLDKGRYPTVRYAGQPIAAVAATHPHIADEAAQLVKVQYDTKPFVVDMEMARQADAPPVFPGPADEAGSAGGGGGPRDVPQKGNVHGPSVKKRGDIEQGFKDADFIVESKYTT
ncbi:MAG TPA: xanthine dehydrogenase family protein molybdopterin-binding subunit, partial [Acidobacteriaceae bacterium]|nr:xanthine dehydrogenase family protein molybdopterin-binding subunit [Acidobacteriaceae bacterium]